MEKLGRILQAEDAARAVVADARAEAAQRLSAAKAAAEAAMREERTEAQRLASTERGRVLADARAQVAAIRSETAAGIDDLDRQAQAAGAQALDAVLGVLKGQ